MKFFNGLMKMSWKLTLKGSSSAYNREKNIFIGGEGIQKGKSAWTHNQQR